MAFGNPDLDIMALMNPQWARWFDTIKENTGGQDIRFAPQPKTAESNQFRGWSTQPSYLGLQSLIGRPAKKKKYIPQTAVMDLPDTTYEF